MKQALQYLTDVTVSDVLLRYLLDLILNNKLNLTYIKLDELISIHKEHSETRNHYFTDMYNELQRKQSEIEIINVLKKAFAHRSEITEDDISSLVITLQQKSEANMNLVAVEFTYNAMKAFYKITRSNSCC